LTSGLVLGLTIFLRNLESESESKTKKQASFLFIFQEREKSSISLAAGCELFLRFVTRTSALEHEDINAGKERLIERGEQFSEISIKVNPFLKPVNVLDHFPERGQRLFY
jgi:hypothetical protein